MAGLKVIDEGADAAAAAKDAGEQGAEQAAATDATTQGTEQAAAEGDGGVSAAEDPAVAALREERDAALARAEKAEADYLAQSDELAKANAALFAAKDENATGDEDKARIAELEAQIAAMQAAQPTPPAPVDVDIKYPKVGKALKIPEEGKRATAADVANLLAAGDVLVMVLTDSNGKVQDYAPQVGGPGLFIARDTGLMFGADIDLKPEMPRIELRFAVLLDAAGKVLSSCRLGALLIGGDGLSAMIPANNLRFDFEEE